MRYLLSTFLLVLSLCGSAHADITSNLAYHWRYDNDLTEEVASNGMTETAGTVAFSNSALPFSGPGTTYNAVVEAADAMDSDAACTGITGAWTYAFWFKSTQANFTFMGHSDATSGNAGITFRVISSTGMRVTAVDSGYTLTGSTAVDDGAWHHICATFDGTNSAGLTLYVDGASDATGAGTDAVNDPDGVFTTLASKDFEIDDLRIYTRELTSGDVAELDAWTGDTSSPLLLILLMSVTLTLPIFRYFRGR